MNDDFIYRALPRVRKDFAQSLYTRISANTYPIPQRAKPSIQKIPRRWQVGILLFAVLVLLAWSQIRLWIRYVPIGDLWLIEFSQSTEQAPNGQLMTPVVPRSGSPAPTAIIEVNGTKHVITIDWYRFAYPLPEWVPDGFSATTIPDSGYAYEESLGMWSNDHKATIRLFAVPKVGGARPYAPPGMYKEVRVNGQPAILVYGRLAPNSSENPQAQRQWDETLGLQLSWSIEEYIYTLETLGPYISADDLIRMAESMEIQPAPRETSTP